MGSMKLAIVLVALLGCGVHAATFYADSVNGNDSFDGTSPSTAWKTLKKAAGYGWEPGFRGGDALLLSGTFTEYLFLQLDKSFGNAIDPVVIGSADPAQRATIDVAGSNGINIYSWQVPAGGMGFHIRDLIIKGDGALDDKGKTTGGIYIYHDCPGNISGLTITNVDVSGFSESGLFSYRGNFSQNQTGWIQDIVVRDSVFHDNPGYPNNHPSGSGIVLAGVQNVLIENCEAYGNGARNTNPSGGPVGMWVYDADRVVFRNCTSHDNLSTNHDGGGFDFDGGTTNSLIEHCTSYNNWGPGYEACSYAEDYLNNGGTNQNNTIRDSTSVGDGYGKKFASFGVDAAGASIQDLTIANLKVTISQANCDYFGSNYTTMHGIWFSTDQYAVFNNVHVTGNAFICNSKTYTQDLLCNFPSGTKPYCTGVQQWRIPGDSRRRVPA
jgi:hypothetical protein